MTHAVDRATTTCQGGAGKMVCCESIDKYNSKSLPERHRIRARLPRGRNRGSFGQCVVLDRSFA